MSPMETSCLMRVLRGYRPAGGDGGEPKTAAVRPESAIGVAIVSEESDSLQRRRAIELDPIVASKATGDVAIVLYTMPKILAAILIAASGVAAAAGDARTDRRQPA